ncbi:MAG TPA: hypothetical protein VFE24_03755 [Pirellulales bacterium]|jgi:hypothetical protein|nr:hypothetical protein [Pirellulales bacterium]
MLTRAELLQITEALKPIIRSTVEEIIDSRLNEHNRTLGNLTRKGQPPANGKPPKAEPPLSMDKRVQYSKEAREMVLRERQAGRPMSFEKARETVLRRHGRKI